MNLEVFEKNGINEIAKIKNFVQEVTNFYLKLNVLFDVKSVDEMVDVFIVDLMEDRKLVNSFHLVGAGFEVVDDLEDFDQNNIHYVGADDLLDGKDVTSIFGVLEIKHDDIVLVRKKLLKILVLNDSKV